MKFDIKNNEFMNKATETFHKMAFCVKKASPEILMYGGISFGIVGAVYACVKTVEVHKVVTEAAEKIDDIKAADETEEKDSETVRKEVMKVCVHTSTDILKLYGPAIILGGVGVTSILASNNIVRKRNVALSAAYGALNSSFKKYRDRVVEDYGDEVDRDIRNGIITKKIDTVEKDPETGKDKKKKKNVKLVDPDKKDIFTVYFDNRSSEYSNQHDYNMIFLRAQEAYANNVLQSKKYLFLNDVYDMLGLPRTIEGQVLGWKYEPDNSNRHNYVSFGIVESYEEDEYGDMNPVIALDPNIDGSILNDFTN